jgi:hypothetical protein
MLTIPVEPNEKLDITDLTHASVDGNGVFDVLMRSVKAHIQQEWDANRIKGNEYSTLYLGALQTVLQVSMQYVLSEAKTNVEVSNLIKQGEVLEQQKLNSEEENALIVANTLKANAEKLFIDQKKKTEQANTDSTVMGAGSLLARQAEVYVKQAEGFVRDAEQKAAKIMVDTYNARIVNDIETLPGDANLRDIDIGSVIAKLKTGVGA